MNSINDISDLIKGTFRDGGSFVDILLSDQPVPMDVTDLRIRLVRAGVDPARLTDAVFEALREAAPQVTRSLRDEPRFVQLLVLDPSEAVRQLGLPESVRGGQAPDPSTAQGRFDPQSMDAEVDDLVLRIGIDIAADPLLAVAFHADPVATVLSRRYEAAPTVLAVVIRRLLAEDGGGSAESAVPEAGR